MRLRVNENVVRFRCFGACEAEWDVYHLIRMKKDCSFWQAQLALAGALKIDDFQPWLGENDPAQDGEEAEDSEDPVETTEPEILSPEIVELLEHAASFYHDLLMSDSEKVRRYLNRRGVDDFFIREYLIGYRPPLGNEKFRGRALIDENLGRFIEDFRTFNMFLEAGLLRHLNYENYRGFWPCRRYIDFSRRDPFSRNYADYCNDSDPP